MKIVRVAIRGWIDVSVWDHPDANAAEATAEEAISDELHSWLSTLSGFTGPVGGRDDVSVDDWSFTEGIEAHAWDAPLGPGRGSDA